MLIFIKRIIRTIKINILFFQDNEMHVFIKLPFYFVEFV